MITATRQVDVAQDGSMTVWDHGRAIYLSRELAQAVHTAYAHNCDGFECECFQAGHIQCAENGHE